MSAEGAKGKGILGACIGLYLLCGLGSPYFGPPDNRYLLGICDTYYGWFDINCLCVELHGIHCQSGYGQVCRHYHRGTHSIMVVIKWVAPLSCTYVMGIYHPPQRDTVLMCDCKHI